MDDLIAFLRAQLDEDERVALAASPNSWKVDTWTNDKGREFLVVADYGIRPAVVLEGKANADHIARHDPARVLADVEAKRRMLNELYPEVKGADEAIEGEWNSSPWNSDTLLEMLALPYAGRPGYKEKWQPKEAGGG